MQRLEELYAELKNAEEIRSIHPLTKAKERMDNKIEEIKLLINLLEDGEKS